MKPLRARIYASAFSGTVLALIFAAVCVGVQSFELWSSSWKVKPGSEAPVTVRLPSSYFNSMVPGNGQENREASTSTCPQIVGRGEKPSSRYACVALVKAYENARRPIQPAPVLGYFALYLVLGLLLSTFMRRVGMGRARWLRSQSAVFLLMTLMAVASKAILLFTPLPAHILPVAMVPLLSAYFLGRRVSFAVAFAAALVAASFVNFDMQLMLVHLITGVASVVVLGSRKRAGFIVKAGAMAAWVAVAATGITTLLFNGTLNIYDTMSMHVHPTHSIWLAGLFSGLGSGLISLILAPLVGMLVGEVSRGRLLDLQDLDHPLLTRLREKAPSTWEHSRAMANLAEAAAHAIGGNALLVRVGAYYHDVGKSLKPEYFIENQGGGENPHDQLSPHDSARAIFRHVSEGTRMLRQEGVPEDVIEFAFTHHGSSVLEFFWHKNLADGNPGELAEKEFSYPGHKPVTRETGILMVVDAIEAAARTVDQPDKSHFEQLVQRIVFSKLSQGQLDESGLTIADVRVVANTIIDTLVSMYHARIKYPWQTESVNQTGNGTPHKGVQAVTAEHDMAEGVTENGSSQSIPPPAPSDTQPVPVEQQPAPARITATDPSGAQPVVPEPQPVVPEPQPVVPEPQPVVPEPQPVVPEPQPVVPEPQPVVPEPQPVVPEPQPAPAEVPLVPAPVETRPSPVPAEVTPTPAPEPTVTPTTYTGPAPVATAPRNTNQGQGPGNDKDQ